MKKQSLYKIFVWAITLTFPLIGFTSCDDDMDLVVPMPTNYTFNDLSLGTFTHEIPNGGFDYGKCHFNTVKSGNQLSAGFCYSNRSLRSFVWNGDETSVDSMRYSMFSLLPNDTEVYLVCNASSDEAYFTIDGGGVIDYMLIANTTWIYMTIYYGSPYGTKTSPKANPRVPSGVKGAWQTYIADSFKAFSTGDYIRLIATGYRNGSVTGTTSTYLSCIKADSEVPTLNYTVNNWRKWELSSLGEVDKVVFSMESSRLDANGNEVLPHWFCMDGLQLKD